MTTTINKEVEVTAVYFKGKNHLTMFPEQISFAGQQYTFVKSGIELAIRKRQEIIKLFTMTDGQQQFHLKKEGQTWWLLDITGNDRVLA